ncbi:MAG: hypothetical protein ABEJ68_06340 [Halobacteriaceae archaeon]
MSEDASPGAALRTGLKASWNALKTVYYANSVSWRVLKAGALIFLGFFVWAGANILHSVQPGWDVLAYPMAYGFLLIVYGPIHHLVVIPVALRWRRTGDSRQAVGKRLPNAGLALFFVAVLVLGTFPAGPMTIDFASALDESGVDVAPEMHCVKSANGTIHCHLTESQGVARVEVVSGEAQLAVDEDPPYEFEFSESQVNTVLGERKFTVRLLDENGGLVRRYTRRTAMISEG